MTMDRRSARELVKELMACCIASKGPDIDQAEADYNFAESDSDNA